MIFDYTTDRFSGKIPRKAMNSNYDLMYFLEIMDNEGNGMIYPDLEVETPYYFVKLVR
jgi:hypothetical protein